MQDEITDEPMHRVGLSIRLGAGLGLIYAFFFAGCLMNLSNKFEAAAFALALEVILVPMSFLIYNGLTAPDPEEEDDEEE